MYRSLTFAFLVVILLSNAFAAEPLSYFDESTSIDTIQQHMENSRFEVVGIRRAGRVEGYIEQSSLQAGSNLDLVSPFQEMQTIQDSARLSELILRLKDQRRPFVSVLGRIGGIVSRTDLQKPPVRMWLFGIITLIEMRLRGSLNRTLPIIPGSSFSRRVDSQKLTNC